MDVTISASMCAAPALFHGGMLTLLSGVLGLFVQLTGEAEKKKVCWGLLL